MRNYKNPLVFIVEDNEAYAEMICYNVHKRDYSTEVFHSGEDCIRNLYKNPDVIILDYMLGSIDGLEVLKQVKSINPDIQVIFLSGQEDLNVGINSLKYGAYDYVVKDEASFDNVIITLNKISKLNSILREQLKKKKNISRAVTLALGITLIIVLLLKL